MRTRQAFTLIELMVAMVLTIFVMVILTEAFVLSIDTFSALKGIGDMQENLRAGSNSLRFDLSQDHLEGKRRLSDPTISSQKPREGFFVIYQGGPSFSEGIDSDGLPSFHAPKQTVQFAHVLQFTSRLRGNQQQSFYSTNVSENSFFTYPTLYNLAPPLDADATLRPAGGPIFRSQWAEIAYFLAQTGSTEEPAVPTSTLGTPLYGLYRAQFVVVTDPTALNNPNKPYIYPNFPYVQGIACRQNGANVQFYGPQELAAGPNTRTFFPSAPTLRSAALVVPNVISFQVQAIQAGSTATTLPWDVPGGLYDTAANAAPVNSLNSLQGVAITIRVWDNKTRQSRQLTVVQDL